MTEDDLAALEAKAKVATWGIAVTFNLATGDEIWEIRRQESDYYRAAAKAVPALVAEVRRLRALVAWSREHIRDMRHPSAAAGVTSDNTRWGS